jgi:hypothetical protein
MSSVALSDRMHLGSFAPLLALALEGSFLQAKWFTAADRSALEFVDGVTFSSISALGLRCVSLYVLHS